MSGLWGLGYIQGSQLDAKLRTGLCQKEHDTISSCHSLPSKQKCMHTHTFILVLVHDPHAS